jgi:predicted RNA-binding Zn ribbon-like protein
MPHDDVELVIDFLNTVDLETGTDLLDDPAGYRHWCHTRGITPSADGAATRAIRDGLRAAAARSPRSEPTRSPLSASITVDGVHLDGADTVAAVVAAAARITANGNWGRIKLCPGDDCGEAFYDLSRNHSRVWCDMAVCGNVAKVRASRRRARQG